MGKANLLMMMMMAAAAVVASATTESFVINPQTEVKTAAGKFLNEGVVA